jgi:hypothetical protein
MDGINQSGASPRECSGFSVVMVEKLLSLARDLGLLALWQSLWLGNPTKRSNSYQPPQRIAAVLAGLAWGLKGIAPGNLVLRPNSAVRAAVGGAFPDQGTIHRWLEQTTPEQAERLRAHLHQVVRTHGQFWHVLRAGRRLVIDLDAQGMVARGKSRFPEADVGHLGEGIERGYQRLVAYAGDTREVLDEYVRPGTGSLLRELPAQLAGLNEIFGAEWRGQIMIRVDAHGGTLQNLQALQTAGYHYLCRLMPQGAVDRLRRDVCGAPGQVFAARDANGQLHTVECWDRPAWQLTNGRRVVQTRAVVYREVFPSGHESWRVLLTDLPEPGPEELWTEYHQRGGTIEEYNDQSERAYHLQVLRTGGLSGLSAFHALVALCWNLTEWACENLQLPPSPAPGADRERWTAARALDRSQLLWRASHCGLNLFRAGPHAILEVEDTAHTPESCGWRRWLRQLLQQRISLAG